MSTTPTANYGFSKIAPGTEKDVWGPIQSATLDGIDTQIKNRQNEIATKANTSHTHNAGTDLTGTIAAAQTPAYSGDVTKPAGSLVTAIAAGSIANAKLANMAINTIKGTNAGGVPMDLTAAQVNTILGVGGSYAPLVHTHAAADITSGNLVIARHAASVQKFCAVFKFDAGSSVIPVGSQDEMYIPFVGTITGWTILTDVAGTITFDLWGLAYASFPPTVTNTITGSAKPLIGSSARKGQCSTLTGWSPNLVATQTLIANVDACATIKRATLILEINKTA